jgi:hypothetical protein
MGTVFEICGVKVRVIAGDHLPMHIFTAKAGALRFATI